MHKSTHRKIKAWRWRIVKACGTQKAFCEQFGQSESQLSEWIKGKKEPEPENIEKVEGWLKELGV